MKSHKIPEATIIRLSVYSRYLKQLEINNITTISSVDIARGVNGSSAQVRKDLAYFGEFGMRGVGYNVKELNSHIMKILGLNTNWNVVIVGAGNLGSALSQYKGFQERGFRVLGMFDNDPEKIGRRIGEIEVYPISQIKEFVEINTVRICVIAVPAHYAQEVVAGVVDAGVKAILNFAPRALSVPEHVEIRNVDLAVNMEILTFNMCLNK